MWDYEPLDSGPIPTRDRRSPVTLKIEFGPVEMTAFRAPAPRLPGLDLIRACAIAWVMLTHGALFGLTSNDHWLVRYGWFGVDLFFVL